MNRAAVTLSALCLLLAGCTAGHAPAPGASGSAAPMPMPQLRLAAFDSCEDLLRDLRRTTEEAVGPWGLPGDAQYLNAEGAVAKSGAVPQAAAEDSTRTAYSGTNNHEAGVDEPDLVKTDGKRIVALARGGELTVVDAAARTVTGALTVPGATQLLLSGDRALVLGYDYQYGSPTGRMQIRPQGQALLTLVDLAGSPRVVGTYRMPGSLVDARQIDSVARVVIRSNPQIEFPAPAGFAREDERLAANHAAVEAAPASAWLPHFTVTDAGGKKTEGDVDCSRVSRPDVYSGTTLLTIATFDLAAPALGSGDPVSIVADGGIVYANGPSLYIGNDQRWRATKATAAGRTKLFKFAIAGAARPTYVAGGEVDGWVLNQYSLSEWDGRLRVATTDNQASTVYVLEQRGGALAEAGKVGGLGKGERIYSVRFIGTTGYVVTFRQTDPLYTLDLSNPAAPRTVGELKITGYSAYLHPAAANRLLGVGQEASEQGRRQGLQVSLFDTHDLADPARLAQFQVPGTSSAAEWDPHAFLYWPATGSLALPMASGLLVLSVQDKAIKQVGTVKQSSPITRSLVIGGTLWTISDDGAQASDLATLARQAWVAF